MMVLLLIVLYLFVCVFLVASAYDYALLLLLGEGNLASLCCHILLFGASDSYALQSSGSQGRLILYWGVVCWCFAVEHELLCCSSLILRGAKRKKNQ